MTAARQFAVWALCWLIAVPTNVVVAVSEPTPVPNIEATQNEACHDKPVVCENARQGNPASEWDLPGDNPGGGDPTIQGFATEISVNHGEPIDFKIKTDAHQYSLDIYRLGYYHGAGARKVATLQPAVTLPQTQPNCLTDAATGLVDCGNWATSATWQVPVDAVSGIYIVKLVRADTLGSSHMVFVVRDDDGQSDVLVQTSDTTWQAYNRFGGNSLYYGSPAGRAYKVSYNRPFTTRGDTEGGRQGWVFQSEYPMLRWLERNGYDVSYSTGVDTDRRGAELLEHKIFLSVGHDEYWSGAQRTNVEAARDASPPVSLAFFSGNAVFWKTRWEASVDGNSHRTLVCYKETHGGLKIDPNPAWTGTWRDSRPVNPEGPHPENALTGTLFMVNGIREDSIMVGPEFAGHRFWRNTSVAGLGVGADPVVLPPGTLGYEWDEDPDNGFRPLGLQRLSSTTVDVTPQYLLDQGSTYGVGVATHSLTLYRAPGQGGAPGALVFGAGTTQWSWGLDAVHDSANAAANQPASEDMQQATYNLLQDMGVSPRTPAFELFLSSGVPDTMPPGTTISSPSAGANVQSGDVVTISGTASDAEGAVASVEVSVDGSTWLRAEGTTDWQYDWVPLGQGPVTIRSRAIDDSGNVQPTPTTVSVTVTRVCPCSIWGDGTVPAIPAQDDPGPVQLGMRFRVDVPGTIRAVRFYKGPGNDGPHVGNLFTDDGTLIRSVDFTGETTNGWQEAVFAAPVAVAPNTTYVVSYFAPNGHYAVDRPLNDGPGLGSAIYNPPIRALASGDNGRPNGVYVYSTAPNAFPTDSGVPPYNLANYFVDVSFVPDGTQDTTSPSIIGRTPAPQATGVSPFTSVTARFSEAIDPASTSGASFELRGPGGIPVPSTVTYVASTRTATLQPVGRLADATMYTAMLTAGIRDLAGNPLAGSTSWNFTTAQPSLCPCTIWTPETVPTFLINNAEDEEAVRLGVELGVKFRADSDGYIAGIRFYKSEANYDPLNPHVGTLWDANGNQLATAEFINESLSGWQEVRFSQSVPIMANQTYVASYHTTVGRYSVNRTYFLPQFASAFTRAPLRALVDGDAGPNGVYRYGPRGFPQSTFFQSNYWVDVVFDTAGPVNNTAPTALNDQYTTGEDSVLAVPAATGVLANDSDLEGNPLEARLAYGPTHAAAFMLNNDGSFAYTPAANFSGPTDSFTYQAYDGTSLSVPAVVTIAVTPANDAPSAADDHYTVAEEATLSVPAVTGVLVNDADTEGSELHATLVSGPSHASSFTLNANGSFVYVPPADYAGGDSFTYLADDGSAASNIATVSIDVTPVNDPPVAVADVYVVAEDQALNMPVAGVLANDSDVDTGSLTAVLVTTPLHGTLTLNPNGSFIYTPAPDYHGTDGFTYKASDGALDSNVAIVTITVNPVNDAPIAVVDPKTTGEDTPLTFPAAGLAANDTDVDGDSLTVTAVTNGAKGTAVLTAGSITYTPTLNATGSDSFSYTVSDGHGGTAAGTVNVTITAVNDAPVANAGTLAVTEDVTAVGTLVAADVELAPLTYSIVSQGTKGTVTITNPATGAYTYAPNANANGSDSFTFKVNDGTVDSNVATITVTITAVNDVPVFVKGADQTVLEDAAAQTVSAWATGISAGSNESAQAVNFSVSNSNNALFSTQPAIAPDGTLTYTPAAAANGVATVTVQIHDNGGTAGGGSDTSAAQTFQITVTAVNDVPSFTNGTDQTVAEDASAQSVAWATAISAGPANESSQTLNFIVSNTNNPLFSVQPAVAANGTLTYTPAANKNGAATVTVQIHDNGGTANSGTDTSAAQTFTITVTAVNDAPVVTNPGTQTTIEGQPAAPVAIQATDAENDTLTYSATGLPTGLSIAPATGVISGTVAVGAPATNAVTVTVADGHGGSTNVNFTWNVTSDTRIKPVITWNNPATIAYGTALSGTQLNATTTVPGTFVYTPAAGTILNAGAAQPLSVTFTPSDTVTYQPVSKQVVITVTPAGATSTLMFSKSPQQYSDIETFEATVTPTVAGQMNPNATVTFRVGTQDVGMAPLVLEGSVYKARLTVPLLEPAGGTGQMLPTSPMGRTVTATTNGAVNYTVPNATRALVISKEDARGSYDGTTLAYTAGLNATDPATVTLRATVKDITAVDSASDSSAGDISKATVTFFNRDTGVAISGAVPVQLVNANDPSTGTATFNWAPTIGAANALTFRIGMTLSNYYARNDNSEDALVTVAKPLAAKFLTGDGQLIMANSTGLKPGMAGTKNDFGFGVTFTGTGASPAGLFWTMLRSGANTYIVKSAAFTSLVVTPTTAVLKGSATIYDVTTGSVVVDSAATVEVTMTDGADQIGIIVKNSAGTVWFSSSAGGQQTVAVGGLTIKP